MDHEVLCGVAYRLKPCSCNAISRPEVFKEGMARQRIVTPYVESEVFFIWESGYVVRCPKCSAATGYFKTPEEAVNAWNNDNIPIKSFKQLIHAADEGIKMITEELKKMKGDANE